MQLDIIIPCLHNNQKNFISTQKCVNSIRENTKEKYNLIIVENLQRWMSDESDVYVGFNKQRTCAENVNTGLSLSTGDYICVITNDVFVKEGWLESLMECFKDPLCGIATLDSSQFNREPKDEITEMFFGGIWMMPRAVFEKVGFWDESFQHAFDDADYWVRVYQAGYTIKMNHNVVVSHDQGGRTIYELNGDKHHEIFNTNRKRFNEKHADCGLQIFEVLK